MARVIARRSLAHHGRLATTGLVAPPILIGPAARGPRGGRFHKITFPTGLAWHRGVAESRL